MMIGGTLPSVLILSHYFMSEAVQSIVMSMSVSLSLCVCPLAYLENHAVELHLDYLFVACSRGSVLLRRRCDVMYFRFCG